MQKVPELTAERTCSLAPTAAFYHLSFMLSLLVYLRPSAHTWPGAPVSPADILAQSRGSGNAAKAWRGLARRSLQTMPQGRTSLALSCPGMTPGDRALVRSRSALSQSCSVRGRKLPLVERAAHPWGRASRGWAPLRQLHCLPRRSWTGSRPAILACGDPWLHTYVQNGNLDPSPPFSHSNWVQFSPSQNLEPPPTQMLRREPRESLPHNPLCLLSHPVHDQVLWALPSRCTSISQNPSPGNHHLT